ncbi:MAG: hypothetical protein FWE06_07980 [Oscillospiraceae bacterium]|nr:hypothetical protein [Oscillospiraceae bacterium]
MRFTENYRLRMPQGFEQYDIDDHNYNYRRVDEAVRSVERAVEALDVVVRECGCDDMEFAHAVAVAEMAKVVAGNAAETVHRHAGNVDNPHRVTAAQIGADPEGSAAAVQSNLDSQHGRVWFARSTTDVADRAKIATLDDGQPPFVLKEGVTVAVFFENATNTAEDVWLNIGRTAPLAVVWENNVGLAGPVWRARKTILFTLGINNRWHILNPNISAHMLQPGATAVTGTFAAASGVQAEISLGFVPSRVLFWQWFSASAEPNPSPVVRGAQLHPMTSATRFWATPNFSGTAEYIAFR